MIQNTFYSVISLFRRSQVSRFRDNLISDYQISLRLLKHFTDHSNELLIVLLR